MSMGLELLVDAVRELQLNFAEPLTFRGLGITAVVNRVPAAKVEKIGGQTQPSFESLDRSEIDILTEQTDTAPRAGESFKDELSRIHRIESTKRFAGFTRCYCVTSQ